jgi:CubicO group peptidase (beta-lactamase class C family)
MITGAVLGAGVARPAPAAPAATQGPERAPRGIEAARVYVREVMATQKVPGLAVAVSVGGRLVWSEGFGYANLEDSVPATPRTRFRIGSVTKPITALAAALLAREGKLDLDAPVRKYVPSFPDKGEPLTARQLGGHLSGIRHYGPDEFVTTKHCSRLVDALEIFKDDPLAHPPGTQYLYSSYGYTLLGAVIEAVSGTDYFSTIKERVLVPLTMRSTVPDAYPEIIPNRAQFHERSEDGRIQHAAYIENSSRLAGGGLLSTPEDLVRLAEGILGSSLVGPETRALLFTPQKTLAGESTGYGFGWRIETDDAGRTIYSHSGTAMGGRAFLYIEPQDRVIVAVAANAGMSFAQKEVAVISGAFRP